MQFTKKTKYTILISIFILMFFSGSAQEDTGNSSITDTLITQNDSINTKHRFSFLNIFKKKKKKSVDDNTENEQENDTINSKKKRFSLKKLFKRKNKQDSLNASVDSLSTDSVNQKKKFSLFKKNKNDTTNKKTLTKPEKISLKTWLSYNALQQDSLLRAWDDYDREFYVKKYSPNEKERKRAMKRKKNFIDKILLKRAVNKPYLYRKKLINRRIARYKKTMKFDRLKKSDTAPDDTISDKNRYQIVNKKFKREAKQEAIRKNKTVLKFDKKEIRLRRRYALSEKESKILNKGKVVILHGKERIIFNKAKYKQEKFTKKLLALRKKRSIALQNSEVRKKMKEDKKRIAERDRKNAKKRKKRKKKGTNKKHNSSEYPKRYFK